ncbi:MAG: spore germination protein GerW family protein [Bryobacteraceae bacterium]
MPDIKEIAKTTMEEIERVLTAKTVVGDPISIDGATLIPLVSFGFGFGAGGGQGNSAKTGVGDGGGTAGGGGMQPVAVVIVTKDGVKVQPTKAGASGVVEKIAEAIGNARASKAANPETRADE